jgi:hypothetical protein
VKEITTYLFTLTRRGKMRTLAITFLVVAPVVIFGIQLLPLLQRLA